MYSPDDFAGLAALSEVLYRFVSRLARRAIGRWLGRPAKLAATPPERLGISVEGAPRAPRRAAGQPRWPVRRASPVVAWLLSFAFPLPAVSRSVRK